MHKLLSLVGLVTPCTVGLPPFIYATFTKGDWEKTWVARVEENNEVLRCIKVGEVAWKIGYRILVEVDVTEESGVSIVADHIPGYETAKYGIRLRFQGYDTNFMISDETDTKQSEHGGGGVYCDSQMLWNKEGVAQINGKTVGSGNSGEWVGDLQSVTEQIKREEKSKCNVYLMKVVCPLKWKGEELTSIVGSSTIKFKGKLPSLIYRPF